MNELEIEQRIARDAGTLCPDCRLDTRGYGHLVECGGPALPLPTATVHNLADRTSKENPT